jgi:hypothetical protein
MASLKIQSKGFLENVSWPELLDLLGLCSYHSSPDFMGIESTRLAMADYDCEFFEEMEEVDFYYVVYLCYLALPMTTGAIYLKPYVRGRLLISSRYCTWKGSATAPQFHIQAQIISDE